MACVFDKARACFHQDGPDVSVVQQLSLKLLESNHVAICVDE